MAKASAQGQGQGSGERGPRSPLGRPREARPPRRAPAPEPPGFTPLQAAPPRPLPPRPPEGKLPTEAGPGGDSLPPLPALLGTAPAAYLSAAPSGARHGRGAAAGDAVKNNDDPPGPRLRSAAAPRGTLGSAVHAPPPPAAPRACRTTAPSMHRGGTPAPPPLPWQRRAAKSRAGPAYGLQIFDPSSPGQVDDGELTNLGSFPTAEAWNCFGSSCPPRGPLGTGVRQLPPPITGPCRAGPKAHRSRPSRV